MSTCYNIIYDTSTSAFQIHGGTLTDGIGVVLHSCGYYVNTDPVINALLNTSAINNVTSANTDFNQTITSAVQDTSANPDVNVTISQEEIEMKLELVIELITPVIKVEYEPVEVVESDSVVTR
jgi:hypothetical protein